MVQSTLDNAPAGSATLHADGTIDLRKDVGRVREVAERYVNEGFSITGCRRCG